VIARFEAERQALALMDHPSIAKVFDAGATETGRPYFVMELVRGMKITDFCDEKQLSPRPGSTCSFRSARPFSTAHQKGIIHRDIKPSNILVSMDDGRMVPKIIDFASPKPPAVKSSPTKRCHGFRTVHRHPGLHESRAGGDHECGH